MGGFRQIAAVGRIAIMGTRSRSAMSLSSIVSIALVVVVLIGFLAMAAGFRKAMSSGGSNAVAIILSEGARSEMTSGLDADTVLKLHQAPGIKQVDGRPILSPETHVVVNATRKGSGAPTNLTLRGTGAMGLAVRPQAELVAGRLPRTGTNEILVGAAVADGFQGFAQGQSVRLGPVEWQVVGIFKADGSVLESEVWADSKLLASVFPQQTAVQSVRAVLQEPGALAELKRFVAADPRLRLTVASEAEHFAAQAKGISNLITYIGWPLGIAMAIGALAGALNTMYASVASRREEIATLRILGFSSTSVFISTIAEALLLALAGGLLGLAVGYLLFHGLEGATMSGNFTQVAFRFAMTSDIAASGALIALAVGLIGSLPPAIQAVRQKLVDGMTAG
jgi:putative ABC transport system permease protein